MRSAFRLAAMSALGLLLIACGGGSSAPSSPTTTTISAGADQSVNGGVGVNLPGSCTGPGCTNGLAWTQTAGTAVTLNGAATLTASFTAPTVLAPEVLTFQLAVVGSCTGTCSDTVSITVSPAGATVQITGLVEYARVGHNPTTNGLDYAATVDAPVRGASVQARAGSAASTCLTGTLLASGTTDASGNYSLAVPVNTTLKVCVRAELLQTDAGIGSPSWDVQVVDNTASSAIYILESAAASSGSSNSTRDLFAASGWGSTSYTSTRAAAPFAILDDVYSALQKILAVDPDADFDPLDINWSINNTNSGDNPATGQIGTSYYSQDEIYILGDDNNDTDEFDDHVIIHEFGHYLEDNLSRSDSVGGPHSGGDLLDPRVAYGEGFGNAWSGIVTDDPVYRDSFGSQQASGFDINVESDSVSAAQDGWFSETSVQRIIYDLYDATNEGSGDAITLGLAPLWAVWSGSQATTPAMTTIFSFLDGLRDANGGSVAAINALAVANDVNGDDDEFGSDETNGGGLGNSSAASCTAVNEALPVHIPYTVGVTGTINVPSTNNEGEYNALGNRRFITFTVGSTAVRNFTVTSATGDDPDAYLYRAGTLISANVDSNPTTETFADNLTAGTYVLEVYAYTNVDGTAGGGDRCLQVTIN